MNLSEMQIKDLINMKDGKKLGRIVDVIIDSGKIINFIVEPKRFFFNFFKKEPEFTVKWEEIVKIGEDVILVDFNHIN